MTRGHDPCTHICTNHSVSHHYLQHSLKSEILATIQTLNAASGRHYHLRPSHHARTASRRLH